MDKLTKQFTITYSFDSCEQEIVCHIIAIRKQLLLEMAFNELFPQQQKGEGVPSAAGGIAAKEC